MDIERIWKGWKVVKLGDKPSGGEKGRLYDRRNKKRRDQLKVLEIIYESNPELVEGVAGAELPEYHITNLLEEICKDGDGHSLKHRHNFIVRGLTRGNKEGLWDLPVPAAMVTLRRQASPFTPDKFSQLKALDHIYKLFEASLSNTTFYQEASTFCTQFRIKKDAAAITTQQLMAGQILFSAIVNGGLLNRKWLPRLGDAIANRLHIEGNYMWLDLIKPSTTDEEDDVIRRWFPDPLTGLLILRWYKKYGKTWPDCVVNPGQYSKNKFLLTRFFWGLQLNNDQIPNITQLIEASSTRLSMQLPQLFIHYSSSQHTGPSLSPLSWARLRLNRRGTGETLTDSPDLNPYHLSQYKNQRRTNYPDQLVKFRQLQKLLSKYHYKNAPKVGPVCKAIEKLLNEDDELSPLVEALAQWSLSSMRSDMITGSRIKPSSMHTYLSSIGKALITHATSLNITRLSVTDWLTLYDLVVESAPGENSGIYKKWRIINFHHFMVSSYQIEDVEIERPGTHEGQPDSNVVSPKEYADVLSSLHADINQPERLRRIQRLLVILGYRCGLRRDEALTLQIHDLQDEYDAGGEITQFGLQPELIVRNTLQGNVKSVKSTRRLPLKLLLTEDEQEELRSWKQMRLAEIAGEKIGDKLLFCHLAQDLLVLPDRETFSPIHHILRYITGDPSLRYHHLRHSFTNILFLRLLEEDYPGIFPNEWTTDNGLYLLPLANKSLKSRLLLQPEGCPTRKWLYALGHLCGHIDPKETMDTYLHLLDWAKGYALHAISPILSMETQTALLDLTPGSLKIFRNRHGLKGDTTATDLFRICSNKYQKHLADPIIKETITAKSLSASAKMLPAFHAPYPSPSLFYALFLSYSKNKSNKKLTNNYGYRPDQVKEWIQTAKMLAGLTSNWWNPRHTRVNKPKNPNKKEFTKEQKLTRKPNLPGLSPAPPRHNKQMEFMNNAYDNLISAFDTHSTAIEKGLLVFLTRSTGSRSFIQLYREEELANYVYMLRLAKISANRIHIKLDISEDSDFPYDPSYLAKLVGLPRKNIISDHKSTQDGNAKAVVWVTTEPLDEAHNKSIHNQKTWSASGMRFGLFMAAVYLGVQPSPDTKTRKEKQFELNF